MAPPARRAAAYAAQVKRRAISAAAAALALAGLLDGCSSIASAPSVTVRPSPSPTAALIRLPARAHVYFVGDSWTHGYSAAAGHGFPYVVGRTLGWQVTVAPDESGAGYAHTWNPNHPVFPEWVKTLPSIHADLIVLEGGLNDEPGPLDQEWQRVQDTIRTLRAKSSGAPVVVVGPAQPTGTPAEADLVIDHDEAGAAAAMHAPYVSPIQRRWITPSNASLLIDKATGHPSTAGHAYFGARLADALTALIRQG